MLEVGHLMHRVVTLANEVLTSLAITRQDLLALALAVGARPLQRGREVAQGRQEWVGYREIPQNPPKGHMLERKSQNLVR